MLFVSSCHDAVWWRFLVLKVLFNFWLEGVRFSLSIAGEEQAITVPVLCTLPVETTGASGTLCSG